MQTTTHINPAYSEFGEKFTQTEPDSITKEESDLLYGLVRMRKPKMAIEIGTGHGVATTAISQGLYVNEYGWLRSCDTNSDYVKNAREAREIRRATIHRMDGLELLETLLEKTIDFAFIDGGNAEDRTLQILKIIGKNLMSPKGLLVVHDACHGAYQKLCGLPIQQGWNGLIFDSLAGIAIFQAP